ncbi:HAMP domain-containing sensor histidine kinase [uncultured Ferrimonas sp.]|uniref:sensor histidine kinase n=1 Tax=uncultured Ferrimonas sp. TaxID=432640 RepID=UPI002603B0D0|nr:HAMP domain-containing sensor histidine kinase [uncultured Ferrimonas sp.]
MSHRSARSLVTRLALAFTSFALVLALLLSFLVRETVLWAEDSVALRHLEANREYAIAQYMTGAQGPLQMDSITTAYDNPTDLPDFVPNRYRRGHVLEEIELASGEYFYLASEFVRQGQRHPIFLLSSADRVELREVEGNYANLFVLLVISLLMLVLGLSLLITFRRLIQPMDLINQQLRTYKGDPDIEFDLPSNATSEFQGLVQQLNLYRTETQLLLKREQAFARYTSHELRTPLTIIKGANSLLSANSEAKFQQRQQARIGNAANQMEETVEALLSLVRNERHHHEEPLRRIEQDEIELLIDNNKPPALGNPITVSLQVDGNPSIRASQPLLAMVFGNLLRNAIGASINGNIQVHMTESLLYIDDDGSGLGEKSKDGHGLGLMIVTDVCERYAWQFSLVDLPQGGCRAQIVF